MVMFHLFCIRRYAHCKRVRVTRDPQKCTTSVIRVPSSLSRPNHISVLVGHQIRLKLNFAMANHVLFKSACCMTVIHAAAIWWWNAVSIDPWISFVYSMGLLTSLINHGLTSEVYKWSDRAWMALGCFTGACLQRLIISQSFSWMCCHASSYGMSSAHDFIPSYFQICGTS